MSHMEVGMDIRAPWKRVAEVYGDYRLWTGMFPTIHGVKLVAKMPAGVELEIDHDEGLFRTR